MRRKIHGISESDQRLTRETFVPSALRDPSAPCANPHCGTRVAYTGDFCRDCLHQQREMRARLRARRT